MGYNKGIREYIKSISISEEYRRLFGKDLPEGKFFCPFHHNTNTPAAKVYGNAIKCFSCNKSYSTWDLLWEFDRSRIDEIAKQVFPSTSRVDLRPGVGRVKYPNRDSLDLSEVSGALFDKIVSYEG